MTIDDFAYSLSTSFVNVWAVFIGFIFSMAGTLLLLLVGLIVASGLGKLVERVFDVLKIDQVIETAGARPYFERAHLRIRLAYFLGRLAYWFVVLGFLLMISDFLSLRAFSDFLREILAYIPNLVAAVLIMAAAVAIAQFLKKVVKASVMSSKLHAASFLGTLTWWSIVIFGFFTALLQLHVAETIINALITGFIAMVALAGGIAFGLGGKDYANHLLNKLREETENR